MEIAAGAHFGHYQFLSPLGAGGMGEVYLAEDTRLRRKVALKLLPEAFTRDGASVHRDGHAQVYGARTSARAKGGCAH